MVIVHQCQVALRGQSTGFLIGHGDYIFFIGGRSQDRLFHFLRRLTAIGKSRSRHASAQCHRGSRLPQQGGKLFRRNLGGAHHLIHLGSFCFLNPSFKAFNASVDLNATLPFLFQRSAQLIEFFAHFFLQSF